MNGDGQMRKVFINGKQVDEHVFERGSFVISTQPKGKVSVEIEYEKEVKEVVVRPLSAGVEPVINEKTVTFDYDLDGIAKLSVEADGVIYEALFVLLYDADDRETTDANGKVIELPEMDESVLYYGPGEHSPGLLTLRSGQTLFVDEGAIVNTRVRADDEENIKIMGKGIIKVLPGREFEVHRRACLLVGCKNVLVKDITFLDSPTWNVVLLGCEDVMIDGINVISTWGTGDCIDVCGSENVEIKNCFLRTEDDCVAVKAVDYDSTRACKSVRDVRVYKCVCWNGQPGNALELGYETRGEVFEKITFKDIDVIHCEHEGWQSGGVLTIHNGDRAVVQDVVYEDIRIEDAQEKFIDFKVLHAKYTKDKEKGYIRDVLIKDVAFVDGALPPSIIRGWEEGEHYIQNITIENLTYKGKKITNKLDAHMIVELSQNVVFK